MPKRPPDAVFVKVSVFELVFPMTNTVVPVDRFIVVVGVVGDPCASAHVAAPSVNVNLAELSFGSLGVPLPNW